jgi:hypothetical protein
MIRSGRSRMALNPAAFAGERDLHGRLVVDQFMRFDERLPAAVVVRFATWRNVSFGSKSGPDDAERGLPLYERGQAAAVDFPNAEMTYRWPPLWSYTFDPAD